MNRYRFTGYAQALGVLGLLAVLPALEPLVPRTIALERFIPAAHAQMPAGVADWRGANDAVGQMQRGHMDILRWESRNPGLAPLPVGTHPVLAALRGAESGAATSERWTLANAIVAARRARPDLLLDPGAGVLRSRQGQLAYRELELGVERAWIEAITQAAMLAELDAQVRAAQLGAELAQRMVQVGNWPAMRVQQEQLLLLDLRSRQQATEHEALQAVLALWQLVGPAALSPEDLAARLPKLDLGRFSAQLSDQAAALPDPADRLRRAQQAHPLWSAQHLALQQRLAAVPRGALDVMRARVDAVVAEPLPTRPLREPWPHAVKEALEADAAFAALNAQLQSDLVRAEHAWSTAWALAERQRVEVLPLVKALEEDMQQRYNGMLKSTWDLLAAARVRLEAQQAAWVAQKNAALALADLRAVLDGLPYTGTAPGAVGGAGAAAAPH